MKKGQARIIEYSLIVLFTVLVAAGISALIYSFYRLAIERESSYELRQLAIQTSDSVIKLYDVAKDTKIQPANYSSLLISEVNLELPNSVAKRNYEISLIPANPIFSYITNITIDGVNTSVVKTYAGAKIIAKTTQSPVAVIEYDIPNIDISVQGRSKNGVNGKLKYYRYNDNGTLYDSIILGEPDILIRITSIT